MVQKRGALPSLALLHAPRSLHLGDRDPWPPSRHPHLAPPHSPPLNNFPSTEAPPTHQHSPHLANPRHAREKDRRPIAVFFPPPHSLHPASEDSPPSRPHPHHPPSTTHSRPASFRSPLVTSPRGPRRIRKVAAIRWTWDRCRRSRSTTRRSTRRSRGEGRETQGQKKMKKQTDDDRDLFHYNILFV